MIIKRGTAIVIENDVDDGFEYIAGRTFTVEVLYLNGNAGKFAFAWESYDGQPFFGVYNAPMALDVDVETDAGATALFTNVTDYGLSSYSWTTPLYDVSEEEAAVDFPIAIAQGGTGATTVAEALANLGAAAVDHTHDYAASDHVHSGYALTTDVTALQDAIASKANADHTHTEYADVNHVHDGYSPIDHSHSEYASSSHSHSDYVTASSFNELEAVVDSKADASHTHSNYADASHSHSEYATVNALDALSEEVSGKADSEHIHSQYATAVALSELESAVAGKADGGHNHDEDYAAYSHTHSQYATTTALSELETEVAGKAANSHTHDEIYYTESEIDAMLNDKANVTHTHDDYALVNHAHNNYSTTDHTHADYAAASHSHSNYVTVTDFETLEDEVAGKASSGHTHDYAASSHSHDDMYYTESEVDSLLSSKSNSSHVHSIANVTGLQDALDAKANASHSHDDQYYTETEIDTMVSTINSAIAGKANSAHVHAISEVTNLQSELNSLESSIAGKVSTSTTVNGKALSGNIVLSASDVGADASGAAASALTSANAYTDAEIANLLNNSSEAVDSIMELAAAMEDNTDAITALESVAAGKANAVHTHGIADVTNLQSSLDAKVPTSRTVNGKALTTNITLSASDIGADASGAASNALVSANAYTDEQINALDYAASSHSHAISEVANLQSELDALESSIAGKAASSHSHSAATQTTAGFMSAADKAKLDGIAANANNYTYTLPSAGTSLGGVKSGGDVTITAGVITVNDDSHNHVIANIDGLQSALDGKAASIHSHNDIYYTESEVDSKLSTNLTSAKTYADGLNTAMSSRMDSAESKLSGIASGAEVNQNAFSNVVVGDTTIAADTKTDSLTLIAGSNVTLTPNATNDSVTITAKDTVYTHPSSGVSAGTYKSVTVNAQGHVTAGSNPTTLAGYGITDAAAKSHTHTVSQISDLTATAAELNKLDGVTATTAELNILDGVTATAAEINKLDGLTASTTELNYVKGVTSAIQTQLNSKAASSHNHSADNITSGTLPIARGGTGATTAAGVLTNLGITATAAELNKLDGVTATAAELNYVDGVTSNIQTQLNAKAASSHTHNYAGSSSAGGAATSANKLNTNAGDSNTPVYFSNGVPVACTSLDLSTTGNAATATKLATARNIGKASFNGTANIELHEIAGRATIRSSSSTYANQYAKFARIDVSAGAWTDCSGTLEFCPTEAASVFGELVYYFRTSSTIESTSIAMYWKTITNANYANCVSAVKVSDGVYDLYYKPISTWDTMTITNVNCYNPSKITFYSGQSYVESITAAATSSLNNISTKLATARTISLTGDVSGSVSFDGSANASITATVADDSHNHVISNVDGLQSALDGKAASSHTHNYAGSSSAGGAATSANKLATARTISLTGDVTGSTSFDGSGNVSITATVADDSHNHTIANVDGLQSALDGKSASGHKHYAQEVTVAGEDLNNYTDAGIYTFAQAYAPTNVPAGTNGWLVVIPWSEGGGTIKQLWFRHGTSGTNDHETYVRTKISNVDTWSDWSVYYTSSNPPTYAEVGASPAFTNTNGGVEYSYNTSSGKDLLDEIDAMPQGMHTIYSQAGVSGNPKTTEAWRLLVHKTSATIGWIVAFGSSGSIYANYQNAAASFTGWSCVYEATNKMILWSGASYLTSTDGTPQVVTPSKKLSDCRTGWLLLWSDYDASTSTANDTDFCTTYIPKYTPSGGTWGGKAFYCSVPTYVGGDATDVSTEIRVIKPVYVHDNCLKGSYQNTSGGRNDVVLRAVYEV